MSTLEILSVILFVVVFATAIAERINLPYPLLLVVAGLVVGFIPGIPNWHPPSDAVLSIFLPPILFAAARLVSWLELKGHLPSIAWLSILLVFATAFVIAWVLHDVFSVMAFSSALVLGAIIAPTDTVAAKAIMSRLNVQQHIIHTIEIESLFNDATGIVLYGAAVYFVYQGNIDGLQLTGRTVLVGAGGIAIGLVLAWITRFIVRRFLVGSENQLAIIMSLILAYVAYIVADRLGVSGVLAVVTAGLYHKRTERSIETSTRLSEMTVWNTLIFFLNGIIFIVIGFQFPFFLEKVRYLSIADLCLYSLIAIVTLLLLRFIWVAIGECCWSLVHRYIARAADYQRFSAKKVLIVSWSGMRGLVPLALAIALPQVLPNGAVFPYRNLICFLTIVVILFTLLVQGITLPFLIKWLRVGKDSREELTCIETIYQQLTKKTILSMDTPAHIEKSYSASAKQLVESYYANRLLHYKVKYETDIDAHEIGLEATQLLIQILDNERKELALMRQHGQISEEVYLKVIRKIDRDEVGFASYHR